MVDSYIKYGFNTQTNDFTYALIPSTGQSTDQNMGPFTYGEHSVYYKILACWQAYLLTNNSQYLNIVRSVLRRIASTPLPETLTPQTAGTFLSLYVDVYQATQNKEFLIYTRSLVDWSSKRLVRNHLILESANGHVYHNYSRPVVLMKAWLKLYRAELDYPLHWKSADSFSPEEGRAVIVARSKILQDKITLHWRSQNGEEGNVTASEVSDKYEFTIPITDRNSQGPLEFTFRIFSNNKAIEKGRVLVTENASGPNIGPWEVPKWVEINISFTGKVKVTDSTGVVEVLCHYRTFDGAQGLVRCVEASPGNDWYLFTVPETGESYSKSVTIWFEAIGNPSWPLTDVSSEISIPFSITSRVNISCNVGDKETVLVKIPDISIVLRPERGILMDQFNVNSSMEIRLIMK